MSMVWLGMAAARWKRMCERPGKVFMVNDMQPECRGAGEDARVGLDLYDQLATFPSSFLTDFAWGKPVGKVTDCDYRIMGCCNCHKCKPVAKHPDCNCDDITIGLTGTSRTGHIAPQ